MNEERVRKRNWKDKRQYNKTVADNLRMVFSMLGINVNDENFKDSDRRLTQVLEDFTYALSKEGKEELKYLFTRKFKSKYDGMVINNNIRVYSLCPHHFLPINYKIYFAYIPNQYVLGLSKVIDIIKLICLKPCLQEDLTNEIVDLFTKELKCEGCICVIDGEHSCMQIRDSEARETSTITSSVRGIFEKNKDGCKDEFLAMIKKC